MVEVRPLLKEYATTKSETVFREIVTSYLNLVYSTAVRLVNGDTHLAEDVSQRVFADLARIAGELSSDVKLGGWLHRHTCFIASKVMRSERRRRAREEQAVLMNQLNDTSNEQVAMAAPVLDEAINHLGAKDREAIVLRFFEERDFRSVGIALRVNEDAARKRVDRALDKLRALLKRRGVTLSTTALAGVLSAASASAAPAALAAGVTSSALATAAAGGTTAITLLHIMTMSKFQIASIAAVAVALSVPLLVQRQTTKRLAHENETLREQVQQIDRVTTENARLSNLLAKATASSVPVDKDNQREVLKLRGEVGVLRKNVDDAAATVAKASEPPLKSITANPEMQKAIHDQQKMALGMIYKGFAQRAKLPADKAEQLNNLLADNVMTNIDHITAILRDGKSGQDVETILAQQETEANARVKELLGADGYTQFQQYTHDLASYLTSEQFKTMLTGNSDAKDAQGKQLFALMQQETKDVLAARGLPADFQTVPTLNFRNFASEEQGESDIQLLDAIYQQVQDKATFLSPEEIEKFKQFRQLAVNNNRLALSPNRKLMAPPIAGK